MRIHVVIPTYNERENVALLIPEVLKHLRASGHSARILIVDDDSPDGTAEEVLALRRDFPELELLRGRKRGLGSAYIRGFRYLLASSTAEVVVQMDADFSHKPEDLPRLIAAVEAGSDFVIGSRYIAGGSIPQAWARHRKLNSAVGNFAARYVAGLYGIRDCTAGFRAIRMSILRRIDLDSFRVEGYAFQVALLHAADLQSASVAEIPVHFIDRTLGTSKLGLRDIVEFIWSVWWIRLHSSQVFVKFVIVGISGVAVNLGALTLLLDAGVNRFVASPLAIELSIVSNFLLNNFWTFRWRSKTGSLPIRGVRFNAVSLLSLAISYSTFVLLSLAYPDVAPQIHQLVGIAPAMLVNYFLNAYWTFRPAPPPASQPRSGTPTELR